MQQQEQKVLSAPIVAPGDSLALQLEPNQAVVKRLCGYQWRVCEEEIWRVETYQWLADANVNMYIANSVEAANNSFDEGVEPTDVQDKVSLKLRL
jgi:hypothetical protein